jgi:hypothetical protein
MAYAADSRKPAMGECSFCSCKNEGLPGLGGIQLITSLRKLTD